MSVSGVCVSLALVSLATASPPTKPVGILERIVAIVGSDAILLSELRARAKPLLSKLVTSGAGGAQGGVDPQKVFRDMLDRLIDERLIALEADKSALTVTPAEVDAAAQSMATSRNVTVPELFKAANAAGFTDDEYRAELRRQLLFGKVIQLRVRPQIKGFAKLTEAEKETQLDAEWHKWLAARRAGTYVDIRL